LELKILAKNTLILASPKVLKFFVGILRAKFIAVFLGLTGAGIIDQLQDTITQIRNFTLSGLSDGMVKLIAHQNGIEVDIKKVASIIKTYLIMIIPITVSVTILGYIYADEITVYILGDIKYKLYFQIGFAALPLTIMSSTANALLKAYKEIKSFAIAEIYIIIINLVIFLPLVYFYRIPGAVVYVTLSFLVTFLVVFFLMKKNVFKKHNITFFDIKTALFSRKYFKELLAFISYGIVGGIFYVFAEVTIRAIVVNNLGIDKLGLYTPITRWSNLFLGFIMPAIYTYLYPRLSEAKSDNEIVDVVNDVFRLITFVALPFIIIGISTRQWIIPLFYSNEFIEASIYLPYHFATLMFVIWSSIFAQIFWPTGRLKHQFIFVIIINTLSLGLIYLLVPIHGLYGYLIKFTLVPLITTLMYFVFWKNKIKFKFKKENAIIMLYALLCSVLLLLLKDRMIYLQILSISLIIILYFLLKKQEKEFLLKKIKAIFIRK
jgi:PST family polysaccharide transporter